MSTGQSKDLSFVLEELSNVTDSAQFLKGVQGNPEVIFDAIKGLVNKSKEWGSTAPASQTSNRELLEKKLQLSKLTAELEITQQRLKKLEKKASSSSIQSQPIEETLNKLTEVLSNFQSSSIGPLDNHDILTFKGNKENFPVWKDSILMKLKSNPRHFPNEKSKMNFVYSKMSGDCQAHLHSWISEGELLFPSLDAMFDLLGTLFDDPNRVRDAKARLFSNHQRNKPFSSWIAEIRRDAAIAGYDKHLGPLRDLIFLNLSFELKQAVVHEKDIDNLDLDRAIARLQDIDNKQRSLAALASKLRYRSPVIPSISASSYDYQSTQLTTTQGGDAMDLSAVNVRPHGPLSPQEKERRRKLGLCIYCGGTGHVIRNCPIKPPSAPGSASTFYTSSNVKGDSEKA
ncbi:hypothetical protein EPUL_006623 [Erysiphe pulchra]|uniref:CCHC-type domain-containing protein n=1 Tax=Erysiphe pulchra TaxID=225359 RepID=A0A2S4PIY0_9PEZI|nr:hypothetical protein EPUL_006623 [Erysiphe pulchra]